MNEIIVTKDNMFRLAAELQFDVEAEVGHSLPPGAIYAAVHHGDPRIVVNAEKCSQSALEILLRQRQDPEENS